MRAVVQRVSEASVAIGGREVARIGRGVAVLVGIGPADGRDEVEWLADKVCNLRIFSDTAGKMNLSLLDVGGDALVVSQFTLYGDVRKGRRPSFIRAAQGPDTAARYHEVIAALEARGVPCGAGEFGAMMDVALVNQGPVTILLDSERAF